MADERDVPDPPSVSISKRWLAASVVAVWGGLLVGFATVVSIGQGELRVAAVSGVTGASLVGCGAAFRRAFSGVTSTVPTPFKAALTAAAEIVRITPSPGLRWGTATVRFTGADGRCVDAEMILRAKLAVGRRVAVRYRPDALTWVVTDLRPSLTSFDRGPKAVMAVGAAVMVYGAMLLLL